MGLVLDAVTVLILAWCVIAAGKKGFVRTLVDFVGTFVAIGFAVVYAKTAAAYLNLHYVGPFFERNVRAYLSNFLSGAEGSAAEAAKQMDTLLTAMPDVLQNFLHRYSVSGQQVQQAATGSSAMLGVQEAAAKAIATPLSEAVSYALGFVLVFVGVVLIIKVIGLVLNSAAKLPGLRAVNGAMGFALGAVQGIVYVCVFVAVVTYLAPFLNNYLTSTAFDANTISSTLVFRYFYTLSPFKRLL